MARIKATAVHILWLPLNLIQGLFTLAWSAGLISLALILRIATGSSGPGFSLARRVWAPGLVYGAGGRVDVSGVDGLDPKRPAFYVANHLSMIDIPVLMMALPHNLHFIVKQELRRIPFLGWYIAAMGMMFVSRQNPRIAARDLDRAAQRIAAGRSVLSFPEGTRSRNGVINSFKAGVFLTAINARVDVIPVAIRGADRVLPADGFRVRPGRIQVIVGQPIETKDMGPENRAELAKHARRAIVELLAQTPE